MNNRQTCKNIRLECAYDDCDQCKDYLTKETNKMKDICLNDKTVIKSKAGTMDIRVIPILGGAYKIQYKSGGWFKSWKDLTYYWIETDDPNLWARDQPYLFSDFAEATRFVDSLTVDKIKELKTESYLRYKAKLATYKGNLSEHKRNRYERHLPK